MKKILNKLSQFCGIILFIFPMNLSAQTGMKFDNVNDYVSVPNASSFIAGAPSMALSFWVYPQNATAAFPDFDGFAGMRNNSNADFYLLQLSATSVEARFRNSLGTNYDIVFTGLNLNQWNHFVLSYNGTALTLYHNGANVGSIPASGTIASTAIPLEIGRTFFTSPTSSFYLNGSIDNVALWNTSLTASDVTGLYTNTCAHDLSNPALVLCYEFTEGTINGNNSSIPSLFDGKGNINGVFNGLALTGTTSNYALGVSPSVTTSTLNVSTCSAYTSPAGNTYSTPGVYTDTLTNVFGCDSIITINLTSPPVYSTINASVCSSYTTPSGGATYTNSGIYTDTLTSVSGCDSIITINLTIATTQTPINVAACVSYTTPSGGATYTSAGIYNDTLTSSGGCDSILIINLSFPTYQSTMNATACTSYTSPSGSIYTASGTYTELLQSSAGCDSIVTINLTIGNSASSITATACDSYTVPSGTATYTASGVYTDILTNAAGCDSTITITLTINTVDSGVSLAGQTLTAANPNASYQWINCATNAPMAGETSQSYTPLVSGSYAVIVSSANCTDTSVCTPVTVSPNSIDELALNSIHAYPNPVNDLLIVEFSSKLDGFTLQVTNLAGQEILLEEFENTQKVNLSMENFDCGVYFVAIQVGGVSKSIKVIKL